MSNRDKRTIAGMVIVGFVFAFIYPIVTWVCIVGVLAICIS